MPGRTNDRRSRSAREVDGQSLSVEHSRFMEISQCHDGITAGHMGRDATIKAAQHHSWWPNMAAWIADYVVSRPVCARYKAPRHRPYGLLQPLATPDRPWGSVSLDYIEGLPLSEGYDSILVIVDRLTKYAILALTHKTVMAKQTALLLWKHVIRQFGCQDRMVFDRGKLATWFISIAETGRRVDPRRNWTPGLLDLTQFRKEWAIGRTGLHCRQVSVHDGFQVSVLELAKTSSLPQRSEQPVVPSLPYEDLEFEVEALIDLIQEYEVSGGKKEREKGKRWKGGIGRNKDGTDLSKICDRRHATTDFAKIGNRTERTTDLRRRVRQSSGSLHKRAQRLDFSSQAHTQSHRESGHRLKKSSRSTGE
ncbi:uncharacterized protein UDID_19128 [Ustilago sp. UG-2017a]|nr:uncharacterized protein UDID_19128 [Ustilago sp. UG-2017a]